jgi:hypothetical protein
MHVERNICHSLLEYILRIRDIVAVKRNIEEAGTMQHLWLRSRKQSDTYIMPHASYTIRHLYHAPCVVHNQTPISCPMRRTQSDTYIMPHASYVLRDAKKTMFLHLFLNIKTPTSHSTGNVGRQMWKKKLSALKSHDYYVLLQQLIPACIQYFMAEGPRNAVMRLGNVFRMICNKVVNLAEISNLKLYTVETMCLLEMWFFLAFFDIMTHLVLRLIDELDICSPVHARWMYGVKHYLGVLKGFVCSRAWPEASIAIGHSFKELLGF